MTLTASVRPARRALERLFDALAEPARCEHVMTLLLFGYAAAWSLYGAVAKSSQSIHYDMGEMYAWSYEAGLGTPKHPPLGAWLVRAWFSAFPRQDWAYYLFAVLLAAAALWIAWRLSAHYLAPDKRALGIMLLTLVPFYNFLALKFNANSVETPFWAVTTWWFLRSFETRRAGWAVLAGVGAAAATLGKYWAVFLLAGLAVAALADRRRGAYFRSPAPYLTIAVGTVLLAPHLVWVAEHHFVTFRYATHEHTATLPRAAASAANFAGGVLAYLAAPIVLAIVAARPNLAAIRDTVWPRDPDRRMVMIAFAAPLLLAMLAAVALRDQIVSLWAMSAMTLFPVVLLSSPLLTLPRAAAVRVLAFALAFPLLIVAAAPAIAIVIHRKGLQNYASQYRLIARAVEHAWQSHTDAPLRVVGSYTDVVNGIIFYLRGRPRTLDIIRPNETPWVTAALILRDGAAIVCPLPVARCMKSMRRYAARYRGAESVDVTLARRYFGTLDRPVRYRILIVPPQR